MCENIKKCSEDLQKSNLLFGENAKKVIARILIELYCRAENTDFIKSCPNQDLVSRKVKLSAIRHNFSNNFCLIF